MGPRWYGTHMRIVNRRKSPANVGKCPRYYTWGHIAENSNFKSVVNCVPGSNPLRPTHSPVHSADTCVKFAVLTSAMVAHLPGTSKSVFSQRTCFTTTPNTTSNIRITVGSWRVRVMFIPLLPSQAWSHFTSRRRFYGYFMSSAACQLTQERT